MRIALKLQIHNLENRSKKDWKFKKQLKHRSIKSKVALELQTNRDYVESKKGKYEDKEIQHSTQVSSSGGQDSSGGGVSECLLFPLLAGVTRNDLCRFNACV